MARHALLPRQLEDRVHAVGKELGLDTRANSEHRRLAVNLVAHAHGVPLAHLARHHVQMHDGAQRPVGRPPRYGWAGGGPRRRK